MVPMSPRRKCLVAVLCLGSVGFPGIASAAVVSIKDSSIYINDRRLFVTDIVFLCNDNQDGMTYGGFYHPTCEQTLDRFKNNVSLTTTSLSFFQAPNPAAWLPPRVAKAEQANLLWFGHLDHHELILASISSSNLFGFERRTEIYGKCGHDYTCFAEEIGAYTAFKAAHPSSLVAYTDWIKPKWGTQQGDIYVYEVYTHRNYPSSSIIPDGATVDEFLYNIEKNTYYNAEMKGYKAPAEKAIIVSFWHMGVEMMEMPGYPWLPYSHSHSRAEAWDPFTWDTKIAGLQWDGYKDYCGNCASPGMVRDDTLLDDILGLIEELRTLDHVIKLDNINNAWGSKTDDRVRLSNNPGKMFDGQPLKQFSYSLKQDNDIYYLILINKDANSITTSIEVSGLPSEMSATMLGAETIGSASEHKVIPLVVTNGGFDDTFDPFAVHIYQLCPGTACADGGLDAGTAEDGSVGVDGGDGSGADAVTEDSGSDASGGRDGSAAEPDDRFCGCGAAGDRAMVLIALGVFLLALGVRRRRGA